MNWAIYCRFNQARSIIAGGCLRKFYPQIEIKTGGFEAKALQPIPRVINKIADKWNLQNLDEVSSRIDINWLLEKKPRILAADNLVTKNIHQLKLNLAPSQLSQYAEEDWLIPIDPTGMLERELSIELAKVCLLSLRWAQNESSFNPKIDSLLMSIEAMLSFPKKEFVFDNHKTVLDVNLRVPGLYELENRKVVKFDPKNLSNFNFEEIGKKDLYLISKYEIDFPESIFTSIEWKDFLYHLASFGSLNLLGVYANSEISSSPSPILSLLHSHSTKSCF